MFLLVVIVFVLVVTVGGYLYNRSGPGDNVRDPQVKNRRTNWVP
ncbi:MAG TPA: hypothetical protein VF549_08895 [Solirubrobacteraceae bacterium]|jgi:hypothetical protein